MPITVRFLRLRREKKFGKGKERNYCGLVRVIFGNYAEKMHKYLVKGQKVIVEGFLRQDKWEKEGVKKSAISIGVNNIHLIFDSKKQNDSDVNFEYVEEPYVEEDVYIDNEEYGCES